jgi:hypothetical protein
VCQMSQQQSHHCSSRLNPTQVLLTMPVQGWCWYHHSNCGWYEALDSATSIAVGESSPRWQEAMWRTQYLGPPET